ncbi:MAG: nucleotide exchange factor GrpE [Bacteroidales bacterium]
MSEQEDKNKECIVEANKKPPIETDETDNIKTSANDPDKNNKLLLKDSKKTENEIMSESIQESLDELNKFAQAVKNDVNLRNERDKYKDEAIQRITRQLDAHEKGLIEHIKKSLIESVIRFYDSLNKFHKKFEYIKDNKLQDEINFLKSEIIDEILYNNDIDEIEEQNGVPFDRRIHLAKKVEYTTNKELDFTVSKVLKKGFVWNDKIIRKQEVIRIEYKENIENQI